MDTQIRNTQTIGIYAVITMVRETWVVGEISGIYTGQDIVDCSKMAIMTEQGI